MNLLVKMKGRLSHGDTRGIVESILSLGVLQVISYLFPLITIPYLSRTIGLDKFGDLALATAVVVYFQIFVDWGYNFTGTRDVARNRADGDSLSRIYSEVFWGRLLLIIVSLAILTLLVLVVDRFRPIALPIYFRFFVVVGYWLYADWLFQGLERMRYITLLNLLSNILCTGLVFIVIRTPEDYIYQPLLMSLGFVVAGLASFLFITPRQGVKLRAISLPQVWGSLLDSRDMFLNQSITIYFENVVVLLLGFWSTPRANGLFDAGNKTTSIVLRFTSILSRAFYPLLARKIDRHQLFAYIAVGVALALAIIVFTTAPWIIGLLFAPEFEEATLALRVLAPSIVFSTLVNVYGVNYLGQIGQEKCLRNTTAVCAFVGLIVALPLIHAYSWIGGAVALLLFQVLLGIAVVRQSKRKKLTW